MNKSRRKISKKAIGMLEMGDSIDEVLNLLEDVLYDEEDAYDNIPENLQGSWRAMESEDAIDTLNDASDLLTDIQNAGGTDEEEKKDKIQEAIGDLEGTG